MSDKFIGQHSSSKQGPGAGGPDGQRTCNSSHDQRSGGTAGDVTTAVDVVTGKPIHHGREGATIRTGNEE